MRAALLLPLLALSVSAQVIAPRHGDDHDEDMDMSDMMNDHSDDTPMSQHMDNLLAATVVLPPTTAAVTVIPSTTAAAAPTPHDPHNHNSHAKVKEYLDDADVHYWHKFPPTYLDADFRLTKDSVIFGEDLPDDWPGDTPSHPGLMMMHVGAMMLAYFALLPISKSSQILAYSCGRMILACPVPRSSIRADEPGVRP
jgi:hypothetical protein